MAVVGEAHIIVRAITTQVERDIRKGFDGLSGNFARAAGDRMANSFLRGWKQAKGDNIFTRITSGLNTLSPAADRAADKFRGLVRVGFVLGPALSVLVGGIGSVVASLGTLVAAVAAAIPALFSLVNIFGALAVGARVFGFGLKGISGAVSNAVKQNSTLGKTLADVREEFQQLQFQAEAAALSEERAALNLEKARENLLRTADLPPNSAARREAELAFKEADLAYRQAKDRTQDLNEEVAKGPEELAKAAAGSDPYADLTKSQKIFAEFLVKEIIPGIKELRETVAANLLVPLIEDVRVLNQKLFPVLDSKLADIAKTIEEELSTIIAEVVNPNTLAELRTAFDNVNTSLGFTGEATAAAIDGFLSLFNAAQPQAERFLEFITGKLQEFAIWSDTTAGKNRLAEIFQLAGDVAASFGRITGNIIKGIGRLIELNFSEGGAGWELLKWFEEATAAFASLGQDDPAGLSQYFNDVLTNTRAIFSSIGELIKGIFSIADNPAIGETFKELESGVPTLISIIEKNIEAGPALARLITSILEIVDAFTDAAQITVFLDTLTAINDLVVKFVTSDFVQKILSAVGPFFAFTLAIGTAIKVSKFFGSAINGIIQQVTGPLGIALAKGRQAFSFMTYSNNTLVKSFGRLGSALLSGPALIAIGALVAAFIYLYNTSDEFRAFVDTTLKGVLESLGESFGRVMEALQPLVNIFTNELLPTLMDSLQPVLEALIAGIGSLAIFIGNVLAAAVETVVPIILYLVENILVPAMEIFGGLIELVGEFAKALMTGDWAAFGDIFKNVLRDILQGFLDLINNIGNMIIDLINAVIRSFFDGFIGGGIADLIKVFSKGEIDLRANPPQIPPFPEFARIPSFAMGGTVFPSSGGSIVKVAEAGRPERIEPLDPDGLSTRDKAIIDRLTSGQSGITMNVYAAPGMDTKELASEVERRLAFKLVRGRISN